MQALDTTIANVALPHMQGIAVGDPGPDHLGADLLHRRRRDHDAADRLAARRASGASACSSSPSRLHRRLGAVRHRHDLAEMVLFRLLQGIFGAALVPLSQAVLLDIYPQREARPGDGDLGRRRHGGADPGPDAGRLADRELQLALGVLHQPAGRHPRPSSACRPICRETKTREARRFDWFGFAMLESRHRLAADDARPRRAARLVRLDRDHRRGACWRRSPSICSSSTPSPAEQPVHRPAHLQGPQLHHRPLLHLRRRHHPAGVAGADHAATCRT